jgi:hypothetical protein
MATTWSRKEWLRDRDRAFADLERLEEGIREYYALRGELFAGSEFPEVLTGDGIASTLVRERMHDGHMRDPWGWPYVYEASSRSVTLRSLGRDGEVGGDGPDRDIVRVFDVPVK